MKWLSKVGACNGKPKMIKKSVYNIFNGILTLKRTFSIKEYIRKLTDDSSLLELKLEKDGEKTSLSSEALPRKLSKAGAVRKT